MDYHKRVDCDEVWGYSVILLNPKMLVSCPDQSKRKRYNWGKDAVSAFYKNTFNNCEEDAAVVDASLDVDSSIVVVERPKNEKSPEDRRDTDMKISCPSQVLFSVLCTVPKHSSTPSMPLQYEGLCTSLSKSHLTIKLIISIQ
jgi:hypothetical protein